MFQKSDFVFEPGERIRLRFINSSAMTYFDVRIPGLEMTVVQADGNNVQPVNVDEFRIGVAETYDVIVRITDRKAYTIFAEFMGRSGFARGTLAPEEGMTAEVPELREAPLLTMADMAGHMDHGDMNHGDMSKDAMGGMNDDGMDSGEMAGMDHSAMGHGSMGGSDGASMPEDPFYASGSGLMPTASNGGKFLSYADLRAQNPLYDHREPTREIELRLTGNMERYEWSINGIKYEDADPIVLQYGERVRFKFINENFGSATS